MEKNTPNYYAIIPANVRYDNRLCPNAKLLYGEISALCNKKGFCWAGNNYFEELYQVSKRTIQKWIASLVECGYIYCNFKYYENSKVVSDRCLSIIECCENSYPMNINSYPYEKKDIGGYEKKDTYNNTSINNTSNKERKKESNAATFNEILSSYTSNLDLLKALQEYIKMRQRIRKPLTNHALRLVLKKLDGLAVDDYTKISILEQSIMNGWQGLFPLKEDTNKSHAEGLSKWD